MPRVRVPRRQPSVRLDLATVADLEREVAEGARVALARDIVLELLEPALHDSGAEARCRVMRLMDRAVEVARDAAPGVNIRIGCPPEENQAPDGAVPGRRT